MSSRYDYPDPGTDRLYCDGLSEPREPETREAGIDPLSHTAQTIHAATGDLLQMTLTHTTSTDARRMFDLARALRDRLEAVIALSGEQMDTLPLHPF